MRKIITKGILVCFVMFYLVSSVCVTEAYVSEQHKSEQPAEAFLKMMKEHYKECDKKDHLEDFLCLALKANCIYYDVKSAPDIKSVAILPVPESYTFKGGLIKGLSDNLSSKSSFKVVSSEQVLNTFLQQQSLPKYSTFRNDFFDFNNLNKKTLQAYGKLFGVDYLIIPRVYQYTLVLAEGKTIAVSKWALELSLISIKDADIKWILVKTIKSVDIQMSKAEQLDEYGRHVLLLAITGFSIPATIGSSMRGLKEKKQKFNLDFPQFTNYMTDIILTLGKYDLSGKEGVPETEREYKTWLRVGTFSRMSKALY